MSNSDGSLYSDTASLRCNNVNIHYGYVVITYYQLMYAIMHCKLSNEKAIIYISDHYIEMNDMLIDNLKELDIFHDVIRFNIKPVVRSFFENLKKNKPDIAFNEILDPYFQPIFKGIENRHMYIFNEFQLYYYYIEKYCKSITLVEDGYRSYVQQHRILSFKGQYRFINRYVGTYFPQIRGESPKINEYIVNSEVKPIKAHKGLIKVLDFKCMETALGEELLNKIYSSIFKYDHIESNNSALLLTQPMWRAGYCSVIEQMKLYDLICKKLLYQYDSVYIKPHPADMVSYNYLSSPRVKVLDKNFPIEVYNYEDFKFHVAYSFGSTTNGIANYTRNSSVMLTKSNFTHQYVVKSIKNKVRNYKLQLLKIIYIDKEYAGVNSKDQIILQTNDKNKLHHFVMSTVVVNPYHMDIQSEYKQYHSVSAALQSSTYDYFFILHNSTKIPIDTIRGLNYFFKNRAADVVSFFSTISCRVNDDFFYIELDKKSLLHNIYDKLIAKSYFNHGKINLENVESFASMDVLRSIDIVDYYTNSENLDNLRDFIFSEINKCTYEIDDCNYYMTLFKIAVIYNLDINTLHIDPSILSNSLKSSVIVKDVNLIENKRLKGAYLTLYDRYKLELVKKFIAPKKVRMFYQKFKLRLGILKSKLR